MILFPICAITFLGNKTYAFFLVDDKTRNLCSPMLHLFDRKYSNIYRGILQQLKKVCSLWMYLKRLIHAMAKLNFRHHKSSLQHPSEIILIPWFATQVCTFDRFANSRFPLNNILYPRLLYGIRRHGQKMKTAHIWPREPLTFCKHAAAVRNA